MTINLVHILHRFLLHIYIPMGSMYGIYANIGVYWCAPTGLSNGGPTLYERSMKFWQPQFHRFPWFPHVDSRKMATKKHVSPIPHCQTKPHVKKLVLYPIISFYILLKYPWSQPFVGSQFWMYKIIWGFPSMGDPRNGGFIMDNPSINGWWPGVYPMT